MDKKTILIVDDEANIRSLITRMLSKDYNIIKACDGHEGINIACNRKPDLILMDIMMPKVDGYTACHVLKTRPETEAIPVVMLTGVSHELNKQLADKVGADGYLTKPFSLQNLLDTIIQFLPASK